MARTALRPLRLGAHMSIAGGMPRAIDRAAEVAATALQVFVKSARQWSARPIPEDEATAFRAQLAGSDLTRHTLAHASYLINLASPDAPVWERSIAALRDEIDRCQLLGIPYLVFHPGSHVGSGDDVGLKQVVRALDRLLSGDAVTLLLENTAGQGSNLGHRFEHLGRVIEGVRARNRKRLGVCFDTCHAVAAGYGLDPDAEYRKTFADFDLEIGLDRLQAFHLNDSKCVRASRRDCHEHIGRGHVGLPAFRRIVNDPRFHELPMVLETPKGPDLAEDIRNLTVLRGLVRKGRR